MQDSAETEILKPQYNILKSIPHNSVILDCILRSICARQVKTFQDETDLLTLVNLMTELKNSDSDYIKPHQEVLEQLLIIANKTLMSTCLNEIRNLQSQYAKDIHFVNKQYLKQAAELQLTGMHQIISHWTLDYQKTRVLIAVAEGPKEDLIEGQYINALYRENGIKDFKDKSYLDYVIMLPKQLGTITSACLIDDLKERMLNQTIAKNMLGCPKKMGKDVLGPYAPMVLKNIFPSYNQSAKVLRSDKYSFFPQLEEANIGQKNESCMRSMRE